MNFPVSMENLVVESLKLPTSVDAEISTENVIDERWNCPCILCDKVYADISKKTEMLEHFLLHHKLVIADVDLIADLKRYVLYWKERFTEKPLSEFCYSMKTNSSKLDTGPQEMYWFLCDNLPEDRDIRASIQNEALCRILDTQQKERQDVNFSRSCLFCRQTFTGNRCELLDHMVESHAFNLGHPDNIVFVEEFLDRLQAALNSMQCLYCEKTFKDRLTLKEHMRKKQHRQLNPKNTTYDKYYIVNYLEPGKNWEAVQQERDMPEGNTPGECLQDREWADWRDDRLSDPIVCLFCQFSSHSSQNLLTHMKDEHGFDLDNIKTRLKLSFYQQIKLINYIRRKNYLLTCYGCDIKAEDSRSLLDHMTTEGHITRIPDVSVWDQSLYYFPTYENDSLLCCLDDASSAQSGCQDDIDIIPEDPPIIQTDNSILRIATT